MFTFNNSNSTPQSFGAPALTRHATNGTRTAWGSGITNPTSAGGSLTFRQPTQQSNSGSNGFGFNQTSQPTSQSTGFTGFNQPTTSQPNAFGLTSQPTGSGFTGFGATNPAQPTGSGFTGFGTTNPARPTGSGFTGFGATNPAQPTRSGFTASQPTQQSSSGFTGFNLTQQPAQQCYGLCSPICACDCGARLLRNPSLANAVQGNRQMQATQPGSLAVNLVADPYGLRAKLRRHSLPSTTYTRPTSTALIVRPIAAFQATPSQQAMEAHTNDPFYNQRTRGRKNVWEKTRPDISERRATTLPQGTSYENSAVPRRNSSPARDFARESRRRAFRDVTSRTVNYTPPRRSYKTKAVMATPFKPATAFKKKKEFVVSLNQRMGVEAARSRMGMRLGGLRGPSIPRLSRGRWS